MKTVRLGAVDYLNARPLVYGLELHSHRFSLRFDVPSKCAALLHERSIDVGMIPSIEYLRGHQSYRLVPDLGIISDGPVASVAMFTTRPMDRIRTIAADTSSRTSSGLLQVLCVEAFGVDAEFVPMAPQPDEMLRRCDAALLIGDTALFLDHSARGLTKIDLGEAWTRLTGLPFVWAFWAGRPDALSSEDVAELIAARNRGVVASDEIAAEYCGPARASLGQAYLRDNIRYSLGDREQAGLRHFFELALKHDVVEETRELEWY
ncbi:MAG: menaquinone biosynthesis protein [Vicinamibacterales bacterium]